MKVLALTFGLFLVIQTAHALRVSDLADIAGKEALITEIDLSNKGLQQFPVQILKCKNLVSLNLSNNGISKIPQELAALSHLKKLNFSQNRMLNPTDLELVFNEAQFRLNDLQLEDCNLLFIPSSFSKQTDLVNLNVASNRLTALPYSMMSLAKLERINVSSNYLQELAWIVSYWWSLKAIDFSNNEDLLVSSVLANLSYFDQLDEITFSQLDYFPKEFTLLNVRKLTIKNSTIASFPRSSLSTKITQLYIDNCQFDKPLAVVSALNEFVKPAYVHFSNIDPNSLTEFLKLEADSITLFKLGALDIRPLQHCSALKWLDVRGNSIEKEMINEFSARRPDVELLVKEPVNTDIGVDPPIAHFVSESIQVLTEAGVPQEIELGKSHFEIPAEGILDSRGNVYNGPVELTYREFMTPAEIALSGITMTYDSNGETMPFSSGGMFELRAEDANGNELFLNPQNPVSVEMFSSSANPDMEIFVLDKNGAWQQTGNDSIIQPYLFEELELDSVMTADFISKVNAQVVFLGDRFIPVVKRNRKLNSFEITFKGYKSQGLERGVKANENSIEVCNTNKVAEFLTKETFIFEGKQAEEVFLKLDSIQKFCAKKYRRLRIGGIFSKEYARFGPDYISGLGLMPDFENDCYNLKFKFKDEALSIPVSILSSETNAAASMQENKSFFKRFVMAWKNGKQIENRNMRKLNQLVAKRVDAMKKTAEKERKQAELVYRKPSFNRLQRGKELVGASVGLLFQIASFGIINADSRASFRRPGIISTEFVNAAMEKLTDQPDEIYVIDHDINSVVQYDKKDRIFQDLESKTTLLVFFTSGLVGICHSWKNMRSDKMTEVEVVDPAGVTRELFIQKISYAH